MSATLKKIISESFDEDVIGRLTQKTLKNAIEFASSEYYNTDKSSLTDAQFDLLTDLYTDLHSAFPLNIGAPVDTSSSSSKVKLPYHMGSLDKIKGSKVEAWLVKHPGKSTLMYKLDGISGLFVGSTGSMYTRGDGSYGQDISKVLPYIKGVPKTTDTVRGEFIFLKTDYAKLNLDKHSRNVAAGALNAKSLKKDILSLITFVAYELIEPAGLTQHAQISHMEKNKFTVVPHKFMNDQITVDDLKAYIKLHKDNSKYVIDGIVVAHEAGYDLVSKGNPKHAFAYKVLEEEESAVTTITEIEWKTSKHGILFPTLIFESVHLDSSNITRASGKTAAFVRDNVLGPGSKIRIVRSGGVIPDVREVIQASKSGRPAFPPNGTYEWIDSQVHIKEISDSPSDEMQVSRLVNFFKVIKAHGVGPSKVQSLYDGGFTTVGMIRTATTDDIKGIGSFKDKSASNLVLAIEKSLAGVDLVTVMTASSVFNKGLGSVRLRVITDSYPDRETQLKLTVGEIVELESFSDKLAGEFVDSIEGFWEFADEMDYEEPEPTEEEEETGTRFKDQVVVFSGFRDADLEKMVKAQGGQVKTSVSSKTTLVLVKDLSACSGKAVKAKDLGITVELI